MAFISKFKTDTAYSNADINEALSAITGQGVLPSTPNEILAGVSGEGVTMSDMRCQVIWADDEHTSVKICPGTVIMADGSYIIISDELLAVPSEELHYIYIYNDIVAQNIPLCTSALPEDSSSHVLLATVSGGTITDKRRLATSKIADYGTHPVIERSVTITINKTRVPVGEPFASIDVGEGYTHAIFTTHYKNSISLYNFETGLFEKSLFSSNDEYSSTRSTIYFTMLENISVSYVDGVINLYSSKELYSTIDRSFTFYITVF